MVAGLVQTFRAFAYNNAWANHRLLTACEALSDEAFAAERTGFFPSLRQTLNHIHVIDLFYIDALEGGSLGPEAWRNDVPHPDAAGLRGAQAVLDRRLIAVCDALTPEVLNEPVRVHRETKIQIERRDRLLMHLFQHDIHHRGQAHAMLSATNVAPPQLDEFFAVGEAPLRAEEFAALGWAETIIWGGDDCEGNALSCPLKRASGTKS